MGFPAVGSTSSWTTLRGRAGDDDGEEDADGEQRAIRPEKADQPSHQARVERLAENFVLVEVTVHARLTRLSAC
jgi:hypothetical protein